MTISRKSTMGLLAVLVIAPVILAGRWALAELAASHRLKPDASLPASVRTVVIGPEVVEQGLRYSAVVKELQKAELSFRVPGTLEHLLLVKDASGRTRPVHEGDRVPRGAVLAQLDPADLLRDKGMASERLAQAEAKLSQAEADAELARADYRRSDILLKRGSMTQAEMDSARAKLRNTEAAVIAARRDVGSARFSLEQAQANLAYCSLTVPFAEATVATRHVDNFERVTANQPAFLLLDLTSVLVSFRVPDTLVSRLSLGREVAITADALPGERFIGVVHKIGSTADAQTRTYPVEVRVDRPGGLRPGMVAIAHIREDRKAHLLPMTAIAPGEKSGSAGAVVFKVSEESGRTVARKVEVGLGEVVDNRIEVRVGPDGPLRAGDRIIVAGVHRLHDGQDVRPAE